MDQEEAINDLLRDFGLEHANTTRVPIMNDCYELQSLDEQLLEQFAKEGKPSIKNFQSLVGTLLWIARCTRPDIAFAVHKATRQTHKPRMYDWKVAKRVARYLKGTKTFKLAMKNTVKESNLFEITSFSDADFAADKHDRKSLTGGVILLNGMAVNWICKKQGGVSLSTMEAEFVAASEVARELLGIREMLNEFGVSIKLPMSMNVDNRAAIKQVEGEASSAKAKHIDVRVKFLCEYARRGIIEPIYVRSEMMLADALTKVLNATKMMEMCKLLGLM